MRALELSPTVLSPAHPLVAYSTALLGRLYSRQGRYDVAEKLLSEALDTSRQAWGEDNGGTFHNVAALAENYARQGRIVEADNVLLEAMGGGQPPDGPRSEIAVKTLPYAGFFYLWRRRYDDAEDSVVKARETSLEAYGEDHPLTLLDTIALGVVYREQGRYANAEEILRHAVDLIRRYLTDESIMMAVTLHELAVTCQKQQEYEEQSDSIWKYSTSSVSSLWRTTGIR